VLGYRDRGQQSPNRDNAKIRLYTKSSRLRLLLLTRLLRRKNARRKKRKGAKARRRKEERREDRGGRRGSSRKREVGFPSKFPFLFSFLFLFLFLFVFLFFPLRLCAFAPCVKFRLILSVFSATSAGLLSYRPSVRVRCGTTRSEASAPTWMPSRSQGRLLWVRSPPSRPDAVQA